MFRSTQDRVKIADSILNNEAYKEMGFQLQELNRQYDEISEVRATYNIVRNFIRDNVISANDPLNRIEIYSILFDSLAKECAKLKIDGSDMESVD
jgi:hypothetical protein